MYVQLRKIIGSISEAFQNRVCEIGCVLSPCSVSSFVTDSFFHAFHILNQFLHRIVLTIQTTWEGSECQFQTLFNITGTCPSSDCWTLIQKESFCDEGNLSCSQRILPSDASTGSTKRGHRADFHPFTLFMAEGKIGRFFIFRK